MTGRLLGRLPTLPVPDHHELRWAARRPRIAGRTPDRWALSGLAAEAVLLVAALTVAAAWPSAGWLAAVLWLLAALADRAVTGFDSALIRFVEALGVTAALRAMLRSAVALVLLVGSGSVGAAVWFVVAVLAVQAALAGLKALSQWLFSTQVPLLYEAGAPRQSAVFRRYAAVYAGSMGVPVALTAAEAVALAAGFLGSAWLGVGALLVVAVTFGWTLWQVRGLRRSTRASSAEVLDALAATEPRYIVYVAASLGMSRHITNQWLPVFDRVPTPGFVMVRGASELPALVPSRLPVVYAAGARQVEQLTLPGVRAAFYQSYALKNANLLHNPHLVHVMLGHGDSDKATSFNGQAAGYDELWVAGPVAVERYLAAGLHLPEDKFVMVGRPQVAGLAVGPLARPAGEAPVVLYAPTWEGYYSETDHTSLDRMGEPLVAWLLAAPTPVRIWFKPHPASGRLRPAMRAASERITHLLSAAGPRHVLVDDTGMSLNDALNAADVLVTDVSSVASDYLATRRPLVVTDPQRLGAERFAASYPSLRSAYVLDADLTSAPSVFDAALGADPLAAARRATELRVLGDHPDGPQETFNREVARLAAREPGTATTADDADFTRRN